MKKLIALLLALVMVLALAACAAKTEPAKTETTDTKTEQTTTEETKTEDPAPAEETTGEKMYIPVMAKGFQHQFWQAVAKGSEDAAKDLGVEIYFDGPASETEIDAQVNMVKTELAKNPKAMALPVEACVLHIVLLRGRAKNGRRRWPEMLGERRKDPVFSLILF